MFRREGSPDVLYFRFARKIVKPEKCRCVYSPMMSAPPSVELTNRTGKATKYDGYEGIAQVDDETGAQATQRKREEALWVLLDTAWVKLNSLFWVAATCGLIYWTNFFRVIWESAMVGKLLSSHLGKHVTLNQNFFKSGRASVSFGWFHLPVFQPFSSILPCYRAPGLERDSGSHQN